LISLLCGIEPRELGIRKFTFLSSVPVISSRIHQHQFHVLLVVFRLKADVTARHST